MTEVIFEPVIGLEIHAQISTASKMFCRCSNDFFGKEPNTTVCPICMGFPGMLPVMNEKAVKKGVLAALALHCTIPEFSKFDRKNYFYPDLPKGFQISQYDKPVSQNGWVEIDVNGEWEKIRIHRLHLEDDAGKLIHGAEGTLCDFNRSGSPLMEIVSEADMHSLEEASAYAHEIRRILRSIEVSDCDMEKGMMRFDANVSLRKKGEEKFGVKAEVKNLNSFRSLEKALAYEIRRQQEILESGGTIEQETRGWDDVKEETFSQRSKEEAHDYRYFPEPDLPPLVMKEDMEELRKSLPELPYERKKRFTKSYGISGTDAAVLTEERSLADYFEEVLHLSEDPKKTVSFITTILLKHLNAEGISIHQSKLSPKNLAELIRLMNEGKVSSTHAKGEVFDEMYRTGKDPETIIAEKGLTVMSDTAKLEELCGAVLQEHASVAEDYKKGRTQVIGFLVGQVVKASRGQANPKFVNEVLRKLLG